MIGGPNFNPSFANLTALHGLRAIPHPIRPLGTPGFPMPGPAQGGTAPGFDGGDPYSSLPGVQAMQPNPMMGGPMQAPQGNFNLQALMQLLGQQRG